MYRTVNFAWLGLRSWTRRQVATAIIASVIIGLLIGLATVLIPNPIFARDIAPVWWNYPVWIFTSVVTGMLVATYVRDEPTVRKDRQGTVGVVGGFIAWFAVGCPVCNKLALLALVYSGAITYFAPIQPILGIAALVLTGIALVWRLKGQVVCSIPHGQRAANRVEATSENIQV